MTHRMGNELPQALADLMASEYMLIQPTLADRKLSQVWVSNYLNFNVAIALI